MSSYNFLGIIPARGGSTGIKKKNILNLCGKPLLAWTIEAAQKSKLLSDFYVSTEDPEIKSVSKEYGAKVIDRPEYLASDEAKTVDVLKHAISVYDAENIVLLQPTSPIRRRGLIDMCIEEFTNSDCDNLIAGFYCKRRKPGTHNNVRRQDYNGFFCDNGNLYIFTRELVEGRRWGGDKIKEFISDKDETFEIDDDVDLYICEKLLERKLLLGEQDDERMG